jgi:uncharacterized Zn finger protein
MATEKVTGTPRCKRCRRTLRSADSIARQYGRTCARKKRQEDAARLVLANYTEVQVEKVRQLLADGGVQRVNRTTFLAVASNGVDRYEVSTAHASCTCPAGQHGRACYHLAAAQLSAA